MKQGITITQRLKLERVDNVDNIRDVIFTYSDKNEHRDDEYLFLKKLSLNEVSFIEGKFNIPLSQEDTTKLTRTYYVEAQVIYDSGATNKWDVCKRTLRPTLRTEDVDGQSDGTEVEDGEMVIEDIFLGDLDEYYTKEETDEKIEDASEQTLSDAKDYTDEGLSHKADKDDTYTKNEVDEKDDDVLSDAKSYTDTVALALGNNVTATIDPQTFVCTFTLKHGNNILSEASIDLPLESVVVDGEYDSANKQIVLTLENGNTITIPVGDLVEGLVSESDFNDAISRINDALDLKANASDVYDKQTVDSKLGDKANVDDVYDKQAVNEKLDEKQDSMSAGAHVEITEDNEINVTDVYSESEVDAKLREKANAIHDTAKGSGITLVDSAEEPLEAIGIEGKSTQNGTPTIDNPIPIMDVTSPTVNVFKRNIVPLNELSGKTYSKLRCEYSYDSTTNEMVLVSGGFEDTKEIYFCSYSLTDGADYTNQLTRSYITPVAEGMQLKRISKNNVFDSFIPTFASADKKVITGYQGSFNQSPYIVTVPQGAKYMTIRTGVKNAQPNTEYRDNVMICVVGTDETYKDPMIPQTASLDFTLRGIPVVSGGNYTDNNGQQWLCDTIERYKDGSGKYIQRVARVTLDGSVNWTDYTSPIVWTNIRNLIGIGAFNVIDSVARAETSLFTLTNDVKGYAAVIDANDNSYMIKSNRIYFSPTVNGQRLNATQFKEYLSSNSAEVECCLETPTETPLTSEELAELNLDTYYPQTNIISNTDVEIEYICDTKNYIDKKISELQ